LLTECVGGCPKGGGGRRVNLLLDQDGRRRLVHRQLAVHCSREANTTVQVKLVNNEIEGRQSRSKGRQGEVKQSNSESLNSSLTTEEDGVGLGDDDEGQGDEEESDDDD